MLQTTCERQRDGKDKAPLDEILIFSSRGKCKLKPQRYYYTPTAAAAAAAAAAAKSLQSCPTLCDPIDGLLPGSPVPGILQARILEWVAISFSNA